MLDDTPSGWKSVQLGDVCEIARGGSPRPIEKFITDDPDGINWIKIGDASASSKYIYATKEKIRPEGASKSRFVNEGDFLLSNSMSFGRPYILKTNGCIHDGWLVLSDRSGEFTTEFFYYLLSSPTVFQQFSDNAAGSAVKNLNKAIVGKVRVYLPPLAEQERIAEILTSVDDSIRATEAVIAQAERVKQCLADEIVLGLAEEKPISRVKLSEVADVNPRTRLEKGRTYQFVEMANLPVRSPNIERAENKVFTSGGAKFINGDTLFARITPCTENGKLGYVDFLSDGEVAFGSTEFTVLRCRDHEILPKLLYYFCYSNPVRSYAIQKMIGSTGRQRVPNHVFDEIEVPIYEAETQTNFLSLLESLDDQIKTNRQTLGQLQRLKRGLMDDFLTGRVRTV